MVGPDSHRTQSGLADLILWLPTRGQRRPLLNAYFGSFSDAVIERIKSDSAVDHVDQETILTLSATVRQQPATWGLHSVSLCKPGASNYVLDERDRLRTFSYVVNVGINYAHSIRYLNPVDVRVAGGSVEEV
ncbi:hypothetical protein F9C07_2105759 [Aspergillus flavus]|uniref:Uncharacterized protein n=1 Tax=Aspergillus flavus (strain ATCC 200026 / FGSC A1120 / IAM 13836 / NRRL 3357 / JCM 12722 / SRRC 167) TaxID=332952 RepID=A0A7U2QW94_ASPFN|nr:hypothetical protein F9C07_2105759 [Aspergillus flavus]